MLVCLLRLFVCLFSVSICFCVFFCFTRVAGIAMQGVGCQLARVQPQVLVHPSTIYNSASDYLYLFDIFSCHLHPSIIYNSSDYFNYLIYFLASWTSHWYSHASRSVFWTCALPVPQGQKLPSETQMFRNIADEIILPDSFSVLESAVLLFHVLCHVLSPWFKDLQLLHLPRRWSFLWLRINWSGFYC